MRVKIPSHQHIAFQAGSQRESRPDCFPLLCKEGWRGGRVRFSSPLRPTCNHIYSIIQCQRNDWVSSRNDEVLLFRQKDPKPCSPWRGLSDSLRCSQTSAAAELAEPVLRHVEGLKQSSPNLRSWLRSSATPKAGLSLSQDEATRENIKEEATPTPFRYQAIETGEGRGEQKRAS